MLMFSLVSLPVHLRDSPAATFAAAQSTRLRIDVRASRVQHGGELHDEHQLAKLRGESTLVYLAQMVGLALHNFLSAAVGIALAAALVRGIARHSAKTLGNFWVDLVRITYYLLLPICLVFRSCSCRKA
jgi:hypothetical protein